MRRWVRIVVALSTVCCVGRGGFGSAEPPAEPRYFAYATDWASNTLTVVEIDPDARSLTPVQTHPALRASPVWADLHPSSPCLFVAHWEFEGGISSYRIEPTTGLLSDASEIAIAGISATVLTHPAGEFVYLTNHNEPWVHGFRVDRSTCALEEITESPFSVTDNDGDAEDDAKAIAFSPDGTRAWVGNYGTWDISLMHVNRATGELTVVAVHESHSAIPEVAITDSTGDRLYVDGIEPSDGVVLYATDTINDNLTRIDEIPAAGDVRALVLDPSESFLYALSWRSPWLDGFAVSPADGRLTPLSGSPFSIGHGATGIQFVPGRDLIVTANYDSGSPVEDLSLLTFDPETGSLAEVATAEAGIDTFHVVVARFD